MLSGFDRLSSALRRVEDSIPAAVEARVTALLERFAAKVAERTPVDSGRLRAGWRVVVSGRGLRIAGAVSNSVPYARYVEEGTAKTSPRGMFALTLADLRAGRL